MATLTLANLRDRMSEMLGDYWHSTVTTALAASASLIDTTLQTVRNQADYFNRHWAIATSENNFIASVPTRKKISDDDGTSTLTVLTNWLTDGTNLATYEIHKYDPHEKLRNINQSARAVYPILHRKLVDTTKITGNVLPDGHFEEWSSAIALTYLTASSTTAAKTTIATYTWGGGTSVKLSATAAGGYTCFSSDGSAHWRRKLLDLMGRTVTFKAWAYPEVANDAYLEIYTIQADGTTQTLTSTTACPAGQFTLLKLENQVLNDDLVGIQFRFKIATNAKYVYFDNARVTGADIYQYLLPSAFFTGTVKQVHVQTSGFADDIEDDLGLRPAWEPVFGWKIVDDGTDRYLRLPYLYGSEYQIKLTGDAPLEDTLVDDADTMTITDEQSDLLLSYACYLLFRTLRSGATSQDKRIYEDEMNRWLGEYYRLKRTHRMRRPPGQISWGF